MSFWDQLNRNNKTRSKSDANSGISLLDSLLQTASDLVNQNNNEGDQRMVNMINQTINLASNTIHNLPTFTEEEVEELNQVEKELSNIKIDKMNNNDKHTYIKFLEKYIEGIYDDDLDISKIHQHIIDFLQEQDVEQIQELYQDLEVCRDKLKRPLRRTDRVFTEKRVQKIEQQIANLEQNDDLDHYLKSVDSLIEEYNKLGPLHVMLNMSNKDNRDNDKIYRSRIIDEYIKQASKYYNLNIQRILRKGKFCPICSMCLDDVLIVDGLLTCPECCITQKQIIQNSYTSDGCRINSVNKNNYISRENFETRLLRFCGGLQVNFPSDIISKLNAHFDSIQEMYEKVYTSEDIKNMEKDEYGQCGPFTVEDMLHALKILGYEDYYPDVNVICNILWDWDIPYIDNIFKQVMLDYDISNKIYDQIKHKYGKTSSMNTDYHIYRLLERNNYKCKPCNFNLIVTDNILRKYEKIWAEICDLASWTKPSQICREVCTKEKIESGFFIFQ